MNAWQAKPSSRVQQLRWSSFLNAVQPCACCCQVDSSTAVCLLAPDAELCVHVRRFFGAIVGLVGAIGFTPLCFTIPCMLWLKVRAVQLRSSLPSSVHASSVAETGWRSCRAVLLLIVVCLD